MTITWDKISLPVYLYNDQGSGSDVPTFINIFVNNKRVSLIMGDITAIRKIDVIVNAANENLLPGSGVCGAIFRLASPNVEEDCRRIGYCAPGGAVATENRSSFAKYIIHTVGPKFYLNPMSAPDILASCYRETLRLAASLGAKTIAFPCIATRTYGFPNEPAAEIAVRTVLEELEFLPDLQVAFVCYLQRDLEIYSEFLGKLCFGPKASGLNLV